MIPTLQKGDRFLHRQWLNSRLSLEEIKTAQPEQRQMLCQVTKIKNSPTGKVVYWRPVYQHGAREELGSPMYFGLEFAEQYILKMMPRKEPTT